MRAREIKIIECTVPRSPSRFFGTVFVVARFHSRNEMPISVSSEAYENPPETPNDNNVMIYREIEYRAAPKQLVL